MNPIGPACSKALFTPTSVLITAWAIANSLLSPARLDKAPANCAPALSWDIVLAFLNAISSDASSFSWFNKLRFKSFLVSINIELVFFASSILIWFIDVVLNKIFSLKSSSSLSLLNACSLSCVCSCLFKDCNWPTNAFLLLAASALILINSISAAACLSRSSLKLSPKATWADIDSNLIVASLSSSSACSSIMRMASFNFSTLTSKAMFWSKAAAFASLIITLFLAFWTEKSRSKSNKPCNVSSNFIAAFVSLISSSPKPEKVSVIPSIAPEKSPLKNFIILLPNLEIRSTTTSTAAPNPAIAWSRRSTPFCVFVKNETKEAKAITSKPIPVAAIAPFRVLKVVITARTPPFNFLNAPLTKAVCFAKIPCSSEASLISLEVSFISLLTSEASVVNFILYSSAISLF